jgi:4-aminobutyrate aminotransferase-like enzyme
LIKDAEEQLDCSTNGKLAGIWLEPIMGAGGVIPLDPKYVQGLHKIVKRMGGLYISDEVQSGFGRIGKEVWGYKWQGVTPDIVIMAKAIANAMPSIMIISQPSLEDLSSVD